MSEYTVYRCDECYIESRYDDFLVSDLDDKELCSRCDKMHARPEAAGPATAEEGE